VVRNYPHVNLRQGPMTLSTNENSRILNFKAMAWPDGFRVIMPLCINVGLGNSSIMDEGALVPKKSPYKVDGRFIPSRLHFTNSWSTMLFIDHSSNNNRNVDSNLIIHTILPP